MCMSFKVIGPIFAALKAYPRDLSLCEVSFNTIYLLSDTAATQILQSGVIPTMAAITQGFINEASICTLWSGIFINLFTGDASFRAANLSATAANSNTGGNDSGFGLIRAIFAAHKAKDFQLCGILAGIVQSFAREGYFKDHLASVGAELVVGFLGVLNADPTLSHSICPAVMELLPCLGTGSLGQANYAILAKTAQLRAGFLDDLLPVLTVLRRAAERKDNVLTMGASALGLPRTIVGVMQNYAENSAVVEACLCLAARILEENTSLGNDFVQCGYVQCAAAAIRKHGATVPAICAGALDSLLIISMNSAGIQAITSVGVVPLLFELLKAPGVAASTVHAAWGIASWVASRDPTSARLVFTSSDNANIIFTLFDTYSRDPVATERCVGLLVYLAQCPEMRTAVAAPRVLSTLTSVLGSYINNSGVCGHVCNLLSIAADVLSDVSGLKSSISSLLSLVFKFHTDTSIVTYACSTLTKIALRDAAQHCSSFGDYSWASSLCGAIEKNSAAPDLCKPIFEALTVITRVPDVTNFRVLALYTQLFVFVLGKNASDLVIGQYVSSVLRNILNADNVVPTLMGLNDTIPAINAVLMANGTDRTIFVNCSAILQAIVSNKAVFLTFTQSGCANCFYSIYTSFSACAPDIAAEASWINQYIFH